MSRNDKRIQDERCRSGLLRKGYTEKSVNDFMEFWDRPLMRSAFFGVDGTIIGYIDPKLGKVEDRSGKLQAEYEAQLCERPRLTRELVHGEPNQEA